jgi:hypothetical protein
MDKNKNKFVNIIKESLGYLVQSLILGITLIINQGTDIVFSNMGKHVVRLQKRVLRLLTVFFVLWLGAISIILALFFFVIEYLKGSYTIAFSTIGVLLLIIGLLFIAKK